MERRKKRTVQEFDFIKEGIKLTGILEEGLGDSADFVINGRWWVNYVYEGPIERCKVPNGLGVTACLVER